MCGKCKHFQVPKPHHTVGDWHHNKSTYNYVYVYNYRWYTIYIHKTISQLSQTPTFDIFCCSFNQPLFLRFPELWVNPWHVSAQWRCWHRRRSPPRMAAVPARPGCGAHVPGDRRCPAAWHGGCRRSRWKSRAAPTRNPPWCSGLDHLLKEKKRKRGRRYEF